MISQCFVLALLSTAAQGESYKNWQSTKTTVAARNLYLLNNTLMSDVKFTYEESKRKWFHAHKFILATRSPVFFAMFYKGDDSTNISVIHLPDIDEESLMEFLRFLYTDECTMTPGTASKVMRLAQKYNVPSLEEKCVDVVLVNTTSENAFIVLEQTRQLENNELERKCWGIIDAKTRKALASKYFVDIPRTTLVSLLKRSTLRIKEVELFEAILRWADHQCVKKNLKNSRENRRLVLGDAVYELRFLSMSLDEFGRIVPPSGLLTNDEIVPVYQTLMGQSNKGLMWNIAETRSDFLRFSRFSDHDVKEPDSGWLAFLLPSVFSSNPDNSWKHYWTGRSAKLCFGVSKAAFLYGIRLFGDGKGGKYEVNLEVKGVKLSGTFTSEYVVDNVTSPYENVELSSFEIVFPEAISVKPYEDIDITVDARGPSAFFGINEKTTVTNQELTVYFGDTKSYFQSRHRQIYEIILIPVKEYTV